MTKELNDIGDFFDDVFEDDDTSLSTEIDSEEDPDELLFCDLEDEIPDYDNCD